MENVRRTSVDLFAGCGGLSLGAEWSGFDPVLAVERSDMAAETYFANFSRRGRPFDQEEWDDWLTATAEGHFEDAIEPDGPRVIVGDIWDVVRDEGLLKLLRDREVDLVAGGPPCQGFSMAGKRRHDDNRNSLPVAFLDFVAATAPKAVIVENVVGINRSFRASGGADEPPFVQLWHHLEDTGEGYLVQPVEVNAAHFGVPQRRPRMMLLALRLDVAVASKARVVADIWRSKDAWTSRDEPGSLLVPRLGRPGPISDWCQYTAKQALWDLDEGGYKWDADDARYEEAPFAAFMRRHPSSTGETGNPPPNHVTRKHTDAVRERFLLYHCLASMKLEPAKVTKAMRIGKDVADKSAAEREIALILDGRIDIPQRFRQDRLGKPGEDLASVIRRLATKKHSQRVVEADQPAPTVVTLPDDYVHPREPRTMTVRELARLQSFPDWFEFRNKETTGSHRRRVEVPQYSQVGNAVPPLMAQAVAGRLREFLDRAGA